MSTTALVALQDAVYHPHVKSPPSISKCASEMLDVIKLAVASENRSYASDAADIVKNTVHQQRQDPVGYAIAEKSGYSAHLFGHIQKLRQLVVSKNTGRTGEVIEEIKTIVQEMQKLYKMNFTSRDPDGPKSAAVYVFGSGNNLHNFLNTNNVRSVNSNNNVNSFNATDVFLSQASQVPPGSPFTGLHFHPRNAFCDLSHSQDLVEDFPSENPPVYAPAYTRSGRAPLERPSLKPPGLSSHSHPVSRTPMEPQSVARTSPPAFTKGSTPPVPTPLASRAKPSSRSLPSPLPALDHSRPLTGSEALDELDSVDTSTKPPRPIQLTSTKGFAAQRFTIPPSALVVDEPDRQGISSPTTTNDKLAGSSGRWWFSRRPVAATRQ